MAIIGINLDRENPAFTKDDFIFWMPQFKDYIATTDGIAAFNKLYAIANNRIFKSIFGIDWEMAMSYCIAHYLTLIGQQAVLPAGARLSQIAGGGTVKGVLTSATVGEFSKSYDFTKTMLGSPDAYFWNQTSYGVQLMALYKTKAVPSIFVITSNPVPGAD